MADNFKKLLTKVAAPLGFKHRKNRWMREVDGVRHIINVYTSYYSRLRYIDLGILYVPLVETGQPDHLLVHMDRRITPDKGSDLERLLDNPDLVGDEEALAILETELKPIINSSFEPFWTKKSLIQAGLKTKEAMPWSVLGVLSEWARVQDNPHDKPLVGDGLLSPQSE